MRKKSGETGRISWTSIDIIPRCLRIAVQDEVEVRVREEIIVEMTSMDCISAIFSCRPEFLSALYSGTVEIALSQAWGAGPDARRSDVATRNLEFSSRNYSRASYPAEYWSDVGNSTKLVKRDRNRKGNTLLSKEAGWSHLSTRLSANRNVLISSYLREERLLGRWMENT